MMGFSQRAIVAAGLLTVALAGCGKSGGARGGPPPLAVDTAQAVRTDISTYLPLDGQIVPMQDSTLSTPQSGTVAHVYVNEGQHVTAGQLLAKIDDSSLRAQLVQAQGQLAQAQANLKGQSLQNPITSQTVNSGLTNAQQALLQAKNSATSADAAEANAKLVYTQNQQLISQGYVSQTALENARAAYVSAQQTAANAHNSVIQAQAALAQAKQNLGQTGIQTQTVAAAKGAVTQAIGQVKLLETEIAQTNIIAPFAGVVTARLLDPGAFAGPNAPIVRVSQIDHVYVNVNVPDEALPFVRKGKPVTFTTSSVPGKTFTGSIFDVNATPTTGTLSYRARLLQPNPDDTLRGGMLVTVTVLKKRHIGALVVPRTAVFQNEAGANVFTVVDPPAGTPAGPGGAPPPKSAKLVPVQVGLQTDTQSEIITNDIPAGATIITTRPDALQDKGLVAVNAPMPAAKK